MIKWKKSKFPPPPPVNLLRSVRNLTGEKPFCCCSGVRLECVSRRCIHLEKCSDASARDICKRHECTPHFFHFRSFVFLQPLSLNCNKSHPAKRPRYITPHRDASLGCCEDCFLNGERHDDTSPLWQRDASQSATVKMLQNQSRSGAEAG